MSLIRTIKDDDNIPVVDDDEEDEIQAHNPGKRKKELNPLDLDFDALTTVAHPWDFTWAKNAALKAKEGTTTIDTKIQAKLAKKSAEWKRSAHDFRERHRKAGNEENEEEESRVQNKGKKGGKNSAEEQSESENEEVLLDDEDEESEEDEGRKKKAKQVSNGRNNNHEQGDGEEDEDEEDEEIDEEAEDEDGEEEDDGEGEEEEEDEKPKQEDRLRKIHKAGNQKKKQAFFQKAETEGFLAANFTDLHLSRPLLKALEALGYAVPSPIQSQTIPIAMQGKDVCASASTGSGKTAAFVLPVLERLLHRDRRIPAVRVLILTPTRELAVQCHSVLEKLGRFTDVRTCLVMGGLSNEQQEAALRRSPDIIVATPGRIIDHLHNAQSFSLETIDILILDEADRLLDMGFTAEVEEIIKFCPKGRQTLLFSATMTEEVDRLAALSLNNPVRVAVDPKRQVAAGISQEFIRVKPSKEDCREAMLLALCTRTFKTRTIIFFRSKQSAHRMKVIFGLAGLNAAELHGNLPQAQRLEALESFRDGKFDFLLATDLVARGLDIMGIEVIINYVMPANLEQYIHRVGRTARWGTKGKSVSFVGERDRKLLKEIVKNSRDKVKSRIIPQEVVDQFKARIDDMENDVEEIADQEHTERQNRLAERAVNTAKNLIEHHDKIFSRPKRTWFQSQVEKNHIAEQSGVAFFGEEKEGKDKGHKSQKKHELKLLRGVKRDEYSGLSRKKKRNKMALKEMEDDLPNQQGRRQKLVAKAAKKEYHLKRQAFLPNIRDKGAKEKSKTNNKPKPKKKVPGGGDGGGGGTFASDANKPAIGKRKREKDDTPSRGEPKQKFRKKGKGQFKSKRKFQRRK